MIHRWMLALAVGAIISVLPSTGRAARKNPYLARAMALINRAEDEQALPLLRKALRWRGNTPRQLTTLHLYLGITCFNLGKQREAARHFRQAFSADRELKLPADLSPKIVEFVEQLRGARAAVASHPKPKLDEPPPATYAPTASTEYSAPSDRRSSRARAAAQPAEPSDGEVGGRVNWPAWSFLGAAFAAGVTGLALGLVAAREGSDANDLNLPHVEAASKHDTAAGYAVGANVLFALAGAAAVTSGVLFYFGRSGYSHRATVVPIDGGAMLTVGGVGW